MRLALTAEAAYRPHPVVNPRSLANVDDEPTGANRYAAPQRGLTHRAYPNNREKKTGASVTLEHAWVKSLKRGQAAWQTMAPDVCASLRHRLAPSDNLGQTGAE